jgi:dGTP triphosphohydrolase
MLRVGADLLEDQDCRDEMDVLKALNRLYVIESRELQTLQYRERRIVTALCDSYFLEGNAILPKERQPLFQEALALDIRESGWSGTDEAFHRREVRAFGASPTSRVDDDRIARRHRARVICDYVAGFTDRFAEREYRRLMGGEGQAISDFI